MNKSQIEQYTKAFYERTAFIRRATVDSVIAETPENKERRIEQLLKPENYGGFFDYYLGINTEIPMADAPCAWFHTDSYRQIYDNSHFSQFRLWFRGAAKSIHSNVGNPMALKQAGLIKFFLVVGLNELKAKLLLADLQAQFEANKRFIADFGKQIKYGNWADGAFETADGCYFMALGINQDFRGLRHASHRLDLVSVDDVESRKVAQNETLVKERTEKILSDLRPAFGKLSQRLIISNNLIEKNGVIANLMNKLNDPMYSEVMQIDFADGDNNPTWTERYTKADVIRTKRTTDPFTYKREYMNTPVSEGKMFRESQIRFRENINYIDYKTIIGHWDLSYKTEGDYKAFALIGNTGNRLDVLDVFCRKCDISEAIDYHFAIVNHIRKQGATAMYYFDATAAQHEVFLPLFQQRAVQLGMFDIPFPAHASVDKFLRIEATLTAVFFNKQIMFAEQLKTSPDFENAKTQLLAFEKGSKAHDDFPDTLEAAVRIAQNMIADSNISDFKAVFAPKTIKGF